MSNGTLSNGSFTPNSGATTTVITYSFSVAKNKYRTLDNVVLSGTLTCTPTNWYVDVDGDGLGDSGTVQSSCTQPAGYVSNSSDNCDDLSACNYDDSANGSCTFPGCTNSAACNYNSASGCDDGSCTLASGCDTCSGETDGTGSVIDGDSDDDGICNALDNCSNTSACNYDGSLYANESCDVPSGCQTCSGGASSGANTEVFTVNITFDNYATETAWTLTAPDASTAWSSPSFGTSDNASTNTYSSSCQTTTGTYTFTITDSQNDGICCAYGSGTYTLVVGDSSFVSPGGGNYGASETITVEFGCTDSGASNYSSTADVDNGTCTFPGCTNGSACNYDAAATSDDGSCVLASGCDSCSGETDGTGTVVDGDSDDDGVCDGSDLCSNTSACNYDGSLYANAACDVPGSCDTCSGGAVVDGDSDDDGICDGTDLCSNTSACNYDGSAYANAACDIPGSCDTCSGGAVVDGDSDDDGVCDGIDLCSNTSACNYDGALYANAACDVPGLCDTCSGGAVVDGDVDSDGVCDTSDNCTDLSACNYDGSSSNVSCLYNDALNVCGGDCVADNNSNGICDIEECIDSANPVAATNDTTLYLDAAGAASVTGIEMNDGSSDDCAIVGYALDVSSFDCSDIGSPVTVTLTVTDGEGNTDTETATVTVLDNAAPALSASNATVSLSGSAYLLTPATLSASASDNCTASPTIELSKDDTNWSSTLAYTCLDLGGNTVYVRATDGNSNVSTSISVTLTIEDNTDPTFRPSPLG